MPLGEPFALEKFEAPGLGSLDLVAESRAERQRFGCDQLLVEPGRSPRSFLAREIEIGMGPERGLLPAAPVGPDATLNDPAGRGIAAHVDVGKLEMMDPAIGTIDHGIGFAGEFVVEAALHQSPDDGFIHRAIVHRKSSGFGSEAMPRHGPMHRLDDVTPHAKVAQRLLKRWLQAPASRCDLVGKSHAFELGGPADEMLVRRIADAIRIGPQIDHPAKLIADRAQAAVEAGPAVYFDFAAQGPIDVLLGACAQFDGYALLGAGAHSLADVAAIDHQIAAIVRLAAHQDVDVRIVGVPVIDRDPVEPRAKVFFHVGQ